MNITLIDMTNDPINKIAYAARVSHRSKENEQSKSNENLVKDIIKWKHYSVLEHAYASVEIEGISRACSHQLVRHRYLSVIQESQRYVKINEPNFIVPESIANKEVTRIPYVNFMKIMLRTYTQLIDGGIPKEDARMLLPNATPTRMVVTGNFRAWREFIQKREIKAAQSEIRNLALSIKELLIENTEEFLWR